MHGTAALYPCHLNHCVIYRISAVEGFGEAAPPQDPRIPPDWAAAAQSGGEKRFLEGLQPSKPPTEEVTV